MDDLAALEMLHQAGKREGIEHAVGGHAAFCAPFPHPGLRLTSARLLERSLISLAAMPPENCERRKRQHIEIVCSFILCVG